MHKVLNFCLTAVAWTNISMLMITGGLESDWTKQQIQNQELIPNNDTTPFMNQNSIDITNKYENLYVVGDSLSDQGNLTQISQNFYDKTFISNNYSTDWFVNNRVLNIPLIDKIWGDKFLLARDLIWPFYPKSIQLDKNYYQSRTFSNGPTAVELLGQKLGVETNPGYWFEVGDFSKTIVKKHGTNFAVGGARITEGAGIENWMLNHFTLPKQVSSLIKQQQASRKSGIAFQSNDLIYVGAGGNDLIGLWDDRDSRNTIDEETFADEMFASLKSSVQKLVAVSDSTSIIVSNLIDVTKTPRIAKGQNQFKSLFMSLKQIVLKFNQKIDNLRKDLNLYESQKTSIEIFDMNHEFTKNEFKAETNSFDFKMNFSNYGESNLDWEIFGSSTYKLTPGVNLSENPAEYFFFDDIHPSKKIHEILAFEMSNLVSKLLPLSLEQVTHQVTSFFNQEHFLQITNLDKWDNILRLIQDKFTNWFPEKIGDKLTIGWLDANLIENSITSETIKQKMWVLFDGKEILKNENLDQQFEIKIAGIQIVEKKIRDFFEITHDLEMSLSNSLLDVLTETKKRLELELSLKWYDSLETLSLKFANLDEDEIDGFSLFSDQRSLYLLVKINDQEIFKNEQKVALKFVKPQDLFQDVKNFFKEFHSLGLSTSNNKNDAVAAISKKLNTIIPTNSLKLVNIFIIEGGDLKLLYNQPNEVQVVFQLMNKISVIGIAKVTLKIIDVIDLEREVRDFLAQQYDLNIWSENNFQKIIYKFKKKLASHIGKQQMPFISIENSLFEPTHIFEYNQNKKLSIDVTVKIEGKDLNVSGNFSRTKINLINIFNLPNFARLFFEREFDFGLTANFTSSNALMLAENLFKDALPMGIANKIKINLLPAWENDPLIYGNSTSYSLSLTFDNKTLISRKEKPFRLRLTGIKNA